MLLRASRLAPYFTLGKWRLPAEGVGPVTPTKQPASSSTCRQVEQC